MAVSDEDLMKNYIKEDAMAFEILYQRYSGKVLGYLIQKTRSKVMAQDLTQDVFLKLHRSRGLYNPNLDFAPWLFTIARSVFLDSVKRRSLEDLTEAKDFEQIPAVIEFEKTSLDLSSLPEIQKKVVGMRVYDEATFEEIAEKLSTTPQNIRQIFSRAVKNLKAVFGKDEVNETE